MVKRHCISFIFSVFIFCSCNNTRNQYGESLYKAYCQNCHMENGDGLQGLIPPIANSDYLLDNYNSLSCIIKNGLKDTLVVNGVIYDNPMEGIPHLTDIQLSNLINYITDKWYSQKKIVTPEVVKARSKECN